jgi:(2Fe-2S) ferredoxin
MSSRKDAPYDCHIFVCVNDRGGVRKSCADGDNVTVRQLIKEAVTRRGWKPRVRVSQCGCLGLCADGPNVIVYPQKIWFSGVTQEDLDEILAAVEQILAG